MSFVARHGLWSKEQEDAAAEMRESRREARPRDCPVLVPRSARDSARQDADCRRSARARWKAAAWRRPRCSPRTPRTEPSFRSSPPGGGFGMREMQGAADVLLIPDPTDVPGSAVGEIAGWLLCDLYFANGRPVPFATRGLIARRSASLPKRGYDFTAGLEVEFHLFRLERQPHGPGALRPAGRAAGRLSALARLPISDRAALRSDGAGARIDPPRRDGARPAVALDRSRIRAEPVRIRLSADDRPCAPPTR